MDTEGRLIQSAVHAMSLRTIEAGTYFVRVYEADGRDATFAIEFEAPIRGRTDESDLFPDRDELRGGGGDDTLIASPAPSRR